MKIFLSSIAIGGLLSSAQAGESSTSIPTGGQQFKHFIALNETQTCIGDEHSRPFNNQIRGVNLGGWMVLEPWITPSLFYQFLGKGEGTTALDTYTFCEVLGAEEANKQLRRHWETWVTRDIIQELAASGAVNSLRLPVGDYMYKSYGPYDGCFDGALEYIDELLDWAYESGLTVLIDIHALKDSQNGFDNSGQTLGFTWTTNINYELASDVTFQHWPIRSANWMGEFDPKTASYPKINKANIQHALDVISKIVDRYSGHPAVLGLEPVNEPWQYTPIEELKKYYWEGYLIVKKGAPYWKYIMHDSFRFDPDIWGGFMDGCPERALDTHIYQAWRDPDSRIGFYYDACMQKPKIAEMELKFGPVVVGEWSLATDNCAMWLNGFNDNLPGFPRLPCKFVPCADPYMGTEQPGTPVDPTMPIQGPYGTGMSSPNFGFCPVDRDWWKESSGNPQTGRDWVRAPPNAPQHLDDTDNVMTHLAYKKINAFSGIGHGFYFWNFRTDLDEPRWSYMLAMEKGWIPKGNLNDAKIMTACQSEDQFDYKCALKHDASETGVKNAVSYILDQNNDTTKKEYAILGMSGPEFFNKAEKVVSDYFEIHSIEGTTCDFGGIAMLVESNRTIGDDDFLGWDDDEYTVIYEGPSLLATVLYTLAVGLAFLTIGFFLALHLFPPFKQKVRQSVWGQQMDAKIQNRFLRRSFALDNSGVDPETLSLVQSGREMLY